MTEEKLKYNERKKAYKQAVKILENNQNWKALSRSEKRKKLRKTRKHFDL